METRIRERLVGAIALVAIVVILVPALLTGPRTSAPRATSDAAAPLRSVTIDLTTGERGTIARPRPSAAPLPEDAAVTHEDSAAAPPLASPLSAPSTPPSPPPASAPSTLESPPSATTIPAAAAAAAATAAGPQGWVVQLGSFASRDNAERFASSLRSKGYAAFVAEFRGSGRVLFRVRVGPEQDRTRAEAIGARLAREGHRGSVAPQP
jgi:DedD protein